MMYLVTKVIDVNLLRNVPGGAHGIKSQVLQR